jgi:hypothetical protein
MIAVFTLAARARNFLATALENVLSSEEIEQTKE